MHQIPTQLVHCIFLCPKRKEIVVRLLHLGTLFLAIEGRFYPKELGKYTGMYFFSFLCETSQFVLDMDIVVGNNIPSGLLILL